MDNNSGARDIMQYSFLVAFANDGTLDQSEVSFMKELALRDGVIDDAEKRVLGNIFSRVNETDVSAEVWLEIQDFRTQYKF